MKAIMHYSIWLMIIASLAWMVNSPVRAQSTSVVTIQTNSACDHCGRNTSVSLVNVTYPDTTYVILIDSLGHGLLPGVWNGTYSLYYSQFGCQLANLTGIVVMGNTTIDLTILTMAPPITAMNVDPVTLLATWYAPAGSTEIFTETWDSGSFATNQWVVSGGNNWQISVLSGNPAPSAMFNWMPQCANCTQILTSKVMNASNAPSVWLQYDIFLDNFSTANTNILAIELWKGSDWLVLKNYDNLGGDIPWTRDSIDISSVSGDDFKIRFRATSENTYDLNNWNIDNIYVTGRDTVAGAPWCLLGYSVGNNSVLSTFVTDTSYQIPPQQAVYGQSSQYCVVAVYADGISESVCKSFTSQYLYPPDSLVITPQECGAIITWTKPENTLTPNGLIGYHVYMNNNFIHYNPHPDSMNYLAFLLTPGMYVFGVTAKYDLGIYGFPNQFGESLTVQDTVIVSCGLGIPFTENWNQGSFSNNNWTFNPGQGNWCITTAMKSSGSCVGFRGQPMQNNYNYALISDNVDAFNWHCAGIGLNFDYKIADQNATGNEKLMVEVFTNSAWQLKYTLSNNGSVDWTTVHIDIPEVLGKIFRIRFVAKGINSADIQQWYIDNINISGTCMPPFNLTYTMNGQMAGLSWSAPECGSFPGPAGYNVYRTDSTGLPPFMLRNNELVAGTAYSDDTGPGSNGAYYYYITAVFDDPLATEPLCESPGSDTVIVSTLSAISNAHGGIRVFPNPADNRIRVISDRTIAHMEVFNYSGEIMETKHMPAGIALDLNVSEYPSGIYFVRVTDQAFCQTFKVVVLH